MGAFSLQSFHRIVACSIAAAILAACGGGGGGGSVTPPGGGGGGSNTQTASVTVNSNSNPQAVLSTAAGLAATVIMPSTDNQTSATLTATLSATPPSGVPTVSDVARRPATIGGTLTPVAYVSVTASSSVHFRLTPGVAVTPVGSVPAYGYLAAYDPANGWIASAGATTLVGGKFTFSPIVAQYTIAPGTTYVLAVFGSATLVAVNPPGNTDPLTCSSAAVQANGTHRLPGSYAAQPQIVPNRLYVTRRNDARVASSVRNTALRTVALGEGSGLVHEGITLPAGSDATAVAAQLRSVSGVVDVAPVHRRFLAGDAAANDTRLNTADQWYLTITNVDPAAWAVTHGAGIKVAVIDTGVDETNADLAPKLDKTAGIVGGVITSSAQDTNGHGSNVSGLVAATTNNNYGFAATGWDTRLLVYKIFPDATSTTDCQGADTLDESTAIHDAVAQGAAVISLSLGASTIDAAERDAVAFAIANNVTVVAAAGNAGPGSPPDYPAALPNVIAVGASAVNDAVANTYASITSEKVASYSNDSPTLVAPGGDALSDNPNLPVDALHWIEGYGTTTANLPSDRCSNTNNACVVLFNGTSQATPQVSAAVALMMAKHGSTRLTPAQVKSILTSTAHPIPGVAATRQGAGRLDVAAAVNNS